MAHAVRIQLLLLVVLSLGSFVRAADRPVASSPLTCSFSAWGRLRRAVTGEKLPPVDQLVQWQLRANDPHYLRPVRPVSVEVVALPKANFKIKGLENVPNSKNLVPKDILELVSQDDKVFWPKHPSNTDSANVPYFGAAADFTWAAVPSASRTQFALTKEGRLVGIKMPTNHLIPGDMEQVKKAKMAADLQGTLVRGNYLARMERKLGADPALIIMKDVVTVTDKETGNGVIYRDMSVLQDGHYYLPAFSIPFHDPKLIPVYAKLVAAAKARLLIRTGMEMETPNPQNWLMQLDKEGKPTGVLVVYDLSDSHMVESVADAIGQSKAVEADKERRWPVFANKIKPYSINSFGLFSGPGASTAEDRVELQKIHDLAYLEEVNRVLGLNINVPSEFKPGHRGEKLYSFIESNYITAVQSAINSKAGKKALADYHEREEKNEIERRKAPRP